MRRIATTLLALLIAVALPAQEFKRLEVKDTIRTSYPNEYLDTVKLAIQTVVNDVSTIGFHVGGTFTGMQFNPTHSQHRDFYPGYFSIMYTHYEKMFDYIPNFGYMVGIAYGHEGYHFKKNKETGNTFVFYKERSEAMKMNVIEVPFMGMIHVDTRNTKAYAALGLYGGYRLSVERFGPLVEPDYQHDWYDSDIRWDFGFQGGAGIGYVLSPFEFILGVQVRYGLSSIFEPDSQYPVGSGFEDLNSYYYRFAYPLDIMVTAGVHFELGKRYGRTKKDLRKEAYDIVYGTE